MMELLGEECFGFKSFSSKGNGLKVCVSYGEFNMTIRRGDYTLNVMLQIFA